MRLDGRRSSNNVDDRRGRSGGRGLKIAGGGIVGIIIAAVAAFLGGGDLTSVLGALLGAGDTGLPMAQEQSYTPTAEDEANSSRLVAKIKCANATDSHGEVLIVK